jgi:hypothetical protein
LEGLNRKLLYHFTLDGHTQNQTKLKEYDGMSTVLTKTSVKNPYLLRVFQNNPLLDIYKANEIIKFCALDIGYHGVKIATEEGLSFIPNVVCPRKEVGNSTSKDPKRIAYRNGKDEFFVGDLAFHLSEDGDIRSNERYNLNFVKTSEFLALFRASVYLATKGNSEPQIATGLPSSAFKGDQYFVKELRKILEGKHEFEIAVGANVSSTVNYEKVSFTIRSEQLLIYPQPIGTLASQAMTIENREFKELNANLLHQTDGKKRTIIDCGFYTVDVHTMVRGMDLSNYCFSLEKGMIEPYTQIKEKIISLTKTEDYTGNRIPIWKLSDYLENKDRFTFGTSDDEDLDLTQDINEIYSRYASEIGEEVNDSKHLNKSTDINEIYLTGGPVPVLKDGFQEIFKKKLKIAKCVINDIEIEPRYFNVIGYFYLQLISSMGMMEEEDQIASGDAVEAI